MTISYVSATSTENFINSIGINTHIDFTSYSSQLSTVEADINYLGVKNIRDSAESSADLGTNGLWQQVANATGAKFDAYAAEGSVATMESSFNNALTLAGQGIIKYIEGGNEEDQSYSESLGNSLATTAAFQQTVYAKAHALGISVINMSFGTGWGSSSTGDYGTVGNLAAYTDYANDHVYFGTGNSPLASIQALNSDAQLAANGETVINSEMGWYTTGSTTDASAVSVTEQAKYMLDGLLDAYQAGDAKTFLYELMDEQSNSSNSEAHFGLFYADGSPKPAATALHNMITLLSDSGTTATSFTPDALSYSLSGTLSTDHTMLMEKSDGTYWLAIWNEARLSGPTSPTDISVPNHIVTLSLASAAGEVTVYDPMSGTSSVQMASDTSSVSISVPDHPILVEISDISGTAATTATATAATAVATVAPDATQLNDIALLYEGALGRSGSSAELNYWGGIMANDVSAGDQAQGVLHSLGQVSGGFNGSMTIADGFLNSAEFQSKYGTLDNADFITQIYENALHRAPEAAGAQFYEHLLDTGTSRAVVLVAIAESPEAHQVHASLMTAS